MTLGYWASLHFLFSRVWSGPVHQTTRLLPTVAFVAVWCPRSLVVVCWLFIVGGWWLIGIGLGVFAHTQRANKLECVRAECLCSLFVFWARKVLYKCHSIKSKSADSAKRKSFVLRTALLNLMSKWKHNYTASDNSRSSLPFRSNPTTARGTECCEANFAELRTKNNTKFAYQSLEVNLLYLLFV